MYFAFSLHEFLLQSAAILVMLLILSALIIVHECGHYSVARYFGFQTPVFGFGLPFGPTWTIGKKWGTEFKVHACLIGGYVLIPELGDESSMHDTGMSLKPFKQFPIWQRVLVASAGVTFNVIFAYFIMIAMLGVLGEPSQPTVVYSLVKENPIAANAGILPEDEVTRINGEFVGSPTDAVKILLGHKSEDVKIDITRKINGQVQPLTLTMKTNDAGKVGMALMGKGAVTYHKAEGENANIAWSAAKKLWSLSVSMVDALGQMVSGVFAGIAHGGKNAAGQAVPGLQDIHGVLAVVKIGADIARQDWTQLFLFTVLISLDLAIVNILPIPPLDGMHVAMMGLEAIRGKPMNEGIRNEITKWGFISLLTLMAVIMFNDISALISGKLELKHAEADSQPKAGEKSTKIMQPNQLFAK